ncbi:SRPBCC family protein [Pedobacter aquatilis]|uniref:SRPBCC family protein n=1 Tax=Pedobacter aquatilis TaxID=351343 RepID=UPI00292CB9ED|nr:SRPBCC family protein [Pedobacter aquatilis]
MEKITVETLVNAPVDKVWTYWSEPERIKEWTFASSDWHAPYAENDLKTDGKFKTTMAAKDGSFSFDFEGIYTNVEKHKKIEYALGDGRTVQITFEAIDDTTKIVETFDPETQNSIEMQRGGWQSILDNFKKYTEEI